MEYDAHLSARLPRSLFQRLDRVHERTRIPKAELIRFALSRTLDEYTDRRGRLRRDDLVEDVAIDLHERGLARSTEGHAAA